MNLRQVLSTYSTDAPARALLEDLRWSDGVHCTHCDYHHGERPMPRLKDGRTFQCPKCRKRFTVTTGTALHATKLDLHLWVQAAYIFLSAKKGISSPHLARVMGVTQKTAWFMLHRLRAMIAEHAPALLEGVVQVDETYVGGKNKNRHKDKKAPAGVNVQGRSLWGKMPVVGVMSDSSLVYSTPVKDVGKTTLTAFIADSVAPGTLVMTDEWMGYDNLEKAGFQRLKTEHGKGQYVSAEGATTNAMENYWSHLKRSINGTHHWVSRKHLHRYCAFQDFRHNTRKIGDFERVRLMCTRPAKPLGWKLLTLKAA